MLLLNSQGADISPAYTGTVQDREMFLFNSYPDLQGAESSNLKLVSRGEYTHNHN